MIREDTYIALCCRHDGSSMRWLFLRRLAIAGCRLHVAEVSSEGKAYEKNCHSVDSLQVHVRETDGVGLTLGWRIGGYAGLRRGRTHSACAGEAEAQGIQRLPKKSSRRSALGAASACGTRPLSPFCFPFLSLPPSLCSASSGPSSHRSAISVAGCGTAQASDPCYSG